jgi:streptogramin lyase
MFRRRSDSLTSPSCVLACAAAAVLTASGAGAVSPKYWIHDTAEELEKGDPVGISVLAEGSLRLAPSLEKIADVDEPYVWDAACDPRSGIVYVGTGDEGHVWRIEGKKAVLHYQCSGLETFSVTVDKKGRVFAGSAPEGNIFRIDSEGKGTLLYDAAESYPWDLEIGPDGQLYAAMGSPGAVYRIDPENGKAEKIFETDDNHVVCLAFDTQGNIVLGTEGRGLVVRVTKDGAARVLYDCPQGEVSAVLAGSSGEVWAAAAVPSEIRETTEPQSNADGTGLRMPFEITATTTDEAILYRIDGDGNARRAWESGQGAIYDLAWADDGRVLAVTGEEAGVHAIDADGAATLVFTAEEEQVVSVARAPDGDYLFATANPSRVYRMEKGLGREGTFVSEVLDAKWTASWGRIEWEGEENGGSVKLDVRAGNTDKPDRTWSEWTGGFGRSGELASLEKARFFQWRATLRDGGSKSPVVRRVRVSSLENNLPPHIARVQVVPSGNRFYEDMPELRPRNLYQQIPGGTKVQYSYEGDADEEFPPEMRAPWTQGMRQVQWDAGDPNEDFLLFDLEYRHEDETRWKKFAEELEGKNFSFDSKGVPDGAYAIRVTASDRRFNPGNERTASRESEVFLVDNTPPSFRDVSMRREKTKIQVTGRLIDELSDVVRMEWSLDGGDWVDAPASDGIFDSRDESFAISVEAAPGEEHSIVLRGTDLPGNLGTTRVLEPR